MNDKISVIVPFYNTGNNLNKCIESIINQTYKNLEILLVNDGSTDESLKIAESYKDQDSRIIVINQKNSGVSAARNHGMKQSTGKYLMFIDSDDWVDNDYIFNLYNGFENGIGFVTSGVTIHNQNQKHVIISKCIQILNMNETLYSLFSDSYVRPVVWGKLFDNNLIKDSNLIFDQDIALSEDIKFIMDFTLNISSSKLINISGYHYKEASMTSAMQDSLRSKKIFKEKWLTPWLAYTKMENSLASSSGIDKYVIDRFIESKVECAKSLLRLLKKHNKKNHSLYTELRKYIRLNLKIYLSGNRCTIKQKINTLRYAFL